MSLYRQNTHKRKSRAAIHILMLAMSLTSATLAHASCYDPSTDPDQDLQKVVEQAQRDNKRIILVVGGEWCVWCHILDNFLKRNPDIQALWTSNFITLNVNYSPENKNSRFLSRYPKITGYPHL